MVVYRRNQKTYYFTVPTQISQVISRGTMTFAELKPKQGVRSATTEFAKFDAGLKRTLPVPKEQINRREAEWRKKQD